MARSDHRSNRDAALDLLLYAPLGLALEARTLMPELIERGRNQVTMARMVGRFAVRQGQVEASRRLSPMQDQVESALADLGLVPRPAPTPPPSSTTPVRESKPAPPSSPEPEAPPAEGLAVTDYDSLAASQVVPRLRALSAEELEDIRRYEAAGRGRKTILNRIAQLQSR